MALVLAVGLWFAVKHDAVDVVGVSVPIEFHNIGENVEITTERIPQAEILVRGPEREIHQLRPTEVHVEVDVGGIKTGERTFDLTARQVELPRNLLVEQIIPAQLHLSFDTRLTRQVEVHPRVIGTFAAGQRIAKVIADPAVITISGPKGRVEAVEAAITDAIDASGTIEKATFVTQAYVADPLVQVNHPSPVRVTVIMETAKANQH